MNSGNFLNFIFYMEKKYKIKILIYIISEMCIDVRFLKEEGRNIDVVFDIVESICRITSYLELVVSDKNIYEEENFIKFIENYILKSENTRLNNIYHVLEIPEFL
jgi:hypothetical protein